MSDKTTKTRPLTAKQASFVQYYADSGSDTYNNATQSMIKAGYSAKWAEDNCNRLTGNDRVKYAVIAYRDKTAKKIDVTREEIVSKLRQLAGLDKSDDIQTLNNAEMIRSLELLGRHKAMFTDNIANTVDDQSKVQTPKQQADELRRQIKLLEDSKEAGTAVAS
jgi:phage terminase small subunit